MIPERPQFQKIYFTPDYKYSISKIFLELSGFNSFNFQPAGNIFREALLNGSKQVFWLIKDACNSTGITFPVSRLLPLHR